MTSHAFGLIDQSDEDTLHFVRLLNVEERPFQKISKRLLAKDSLLRQFPAQLPTPPPDGSAVDEAAAATEKERQKQEDQRRQWREEVLVDFQLLEDTLIRIQFLQNSNEKERERYAAQKAKILETAQAVRDNTAELRVQLQDAQETLALRKSYDELAEKITRNKMLRSREEQKASLEKLEGEIADLEQEGRDFGTQWAERREQFSRIVDEGQRMLRLIRGEKEDEGKDESMEDAEGAEDGETKGELSATGTPRPDMGGSTPIPGGAEGESSQTRTSGLGINTPALGTSRAVSPVKQESETPAPGKGQDTEMGEAAATPQTGPVSELEEGEAAEDEVEEGEQMDVT